MQSESSILLPDDRLVGPDGQPVAASGPEVVGIDLYEATGGDDALTLIAKIADLRRRREKMATLVAAPGAITETVVIEVRLFNEAAYRGRDLTELEEAVLRNSMQRQRVKLARRAGRYAQERVAHVRAQEQQATGTPTRSAKKKQAKKAGKKRRAKQRQVSAGQED